MLVILVKESSIVSVIAVTDLMWRASSVASTSYHPAEPLTFAALAYLLMVLPITLAARAAHGRFRLSFEA
jgi:polar amino acid transport system permease protein